MRKLRPVYYDIGKIIPKSILCTFGHLVGVIEEYGVDIVTIFLILRLKIPPGSPLFRRISFGALVSRSCVLTPL